MEWLNAVDVTIIIFANKTALLTYKAAEREEN